ncbi:MAG: IS21-like element helper ATPase IstB [Planctomycetota bacterium]
MSATTAAAAVEMRLRSLGLSSFATHFAEFADRAAKDGTSHVEYLGALCEVETRQRAERRVARLLRASGLPRGKTFATLELERLPAPARTALASLRTGGFLESTTNVLVFGPPGTGKSHVASALGHELVERGHSVVYTKTYAIVQRLLAAKRDLRLPQELRKLDHVECLVLDDVGYVQQDREEMEVLFTVLAERYERRSVVITSNLVFSKWDQIFKNPMTTAAAIDRLVHHAAVLELNVPSYRAEQALARSSAARRDGRGATARRTHRERESVLPPSGRAAEA